MDGNLGKSSFRTISTLTIVVIVVALVNSLPQPNSGTFGEETRCSGDEYRAEKGHCCNKCHSGYKLIKECEGPERRSTCSRCEDEHYLEKSNNADKCFRCKRCKTNNFEKEVSPCRNDHNRECSCIDGYFKMFISNFTWQCLKCKSCKPGEQEVVKCSVGHNAVCGCQEGFYLTKDKECVECQKCGEDAKCSHLCEGRPEKDWQLACMVIVGVLIAILIVIMVTFLLKRYLHKSPVSIDSPHSSFSETSKSLISSVSEDMNTVKDIAVQIYSGEPEVSGVQENLPDCIPREFNACQFIYFLLDHVPADRFKELIRCLGVSDRDIERAERDHHSFKEAQYQMVKVWCNSSAGGTAHTLSSARLLEMVAMLRSIGLAGCAEAIEAKFDLCV